MSCTMEQLSTCRPAGAGSDPSSAASWNRLKLSKELATAIQDDARRKAIDSAKKRAVSQHVDYETFQAMVSVAHLRPIERDEWHRKPVETRGSPAWSLSADGSFGGQDQLQAPAPHASVLAKFLKEAPPKNAEEFQKRWRALSASDADRLRFLRSIPPEGLLPLFKVEIRPGLLGEIFSVLNSCWAEVEKTHSADDWHVSEKALASLPFQGKDAENPEPLVNEEGTAGTRDLPKNVLGGLASLGLKDEGFEETAEGERACMSSSQVASDARDSAGQSDNDAPDGRRRSEAEAGQVESVRNLLAVDVVSPPDDLSPLERTSESAGSVPIGGDMEKNTELCCAGAKSNMEDELAGPQAGFHDGKAIHSQMDCRLGEVLDLLDALAKSGRFGLTLRLLSNSHKKEMQAVFDKLKVAVERGSADDQPRCSSLQARFGL